MTVYIQYPHGGILSLRTGQLDFFFNPSVRNISLGLDDCITILSVNEKLPVSKFRYFGKYIIKLDGS